MDLQTNLSQSLVCPYQILLDICYQILPEQMKELSEGAFLPICKLNSANDWINLESLGNTAALRAQILLDSILVKLRKKISSQLNLHIYLGRHGLTSDNLYFLLFLSDQVKNLKLVFYHKNFDISLKNKLNNSFSNKLHVQIAYISNHNIIEQSIVMLKKLETYQKIILKSQGSDPNSKDHTQWVIGYAWTLLKAGAYELAAHLLEDALMSTQTRNTDCHTILLHLQIIRFHSHQYEALALQTYPEQLNHLDSESLNYLYYLKAYAATLSHHLEIAKLNFELAKIDEHLSLKDEFSLYQLNIFALYNVFIKNTDLSYQLEKNIEAFIKTHSIESIGLKYVNFINIARLHKKFENFSGSFNYYEKAYQEISGGGYTTSDYIYYNMNLGNLHETFDEPKKALFYWIKSALHWLAAKNPYALSWRPKLILCGEKVTELNHPLSLSKVACFFIEKIQSLLSKIHIVLPESKIKFIFHLNDPRVKKENCHIYQGLILYTAQLTTSDHFPELGRLSAYLSKVLAYFIKLNAEHNVLLIDSIHENFPKNLEEAWILAKLNNCQTCYWEEKTIHAHNLSIDTIRNKLKISLSNLIEKIMIQKNEIKLEYKRSFLNKTLIDHHEKNLFHLIYDNQIDIIIKNFINHLPVLERLWYKRVITIDLFG